MRPETISLLEDIRQAAELCSQFAAGVTYETYAEDVLLRSAVERQLTIIGEALYQIRREDPETVATITDAHAIIVLRHILVHSYAVVDNRTVLDVVTVKLPILQQEVALLLREQ